MPQLDFANPLTISQIVWLAIIFGVLYLLLSTWALPRVGRVLDDRATRIANDLNSARAARDEAERAAREAREASQRSHAQAQAEIAAAVTTAKQEAAARAAALNEVLDARIAESERAIAEARRAAMASLRDVAGAAAASMVTRLSGKAPEPAAIESAVGALIDQAA
jgi:F-type H+-transporting ATPase subunit b